VEHLRNTASASPRTPRHHRAFAAFTRETCSAARRDPLRTTDYGNDSRSDKALMEEFGRPYDLRVLEEAKRG